MIKKIKDNVLTNIGKKVKIVYNGSRNRKEQYKGVITEVYDFIFIVKLDSGGIKSYSYADVLIGSVEIFFDKI
mgnify:CR=1 FL=1